MSPPYLVFGNIKLGDEADCLFLEYNNLLHTSRRMKQCLLGSCSWANSWRETLISLSFLRTKLPLEENVNRAVDYFQAWEMEINPVILFCLHSPVSFLHNQDPLKTGLEEGKSQKLGSYRQSVRMKGGQLVLPLQRQLLSSTNISTFRNKYFQAYFFRYFKAFRQLAKGFFFVFFFSSQHKYILHTLFMV